MTNGSTNAESQEFEQNRSEITTLVAVCRSLRDQAKAAANDIEDLKASALVSLGHTAQSADEARSSLEAVHARQRECAGIRDEIQKTRGQLDDEANTFAERVDAAKTTQASIQQLHDEARTAQQAMRKQLDDLADLESKASAVVKELEDKIKSAGELETQVESLLPGATSIGLANSFEEQRKRCVRPQVMWAIVFGATIIAISCYGLYSAGFIGRSNDTVESASKIFVDMLHALPLVLPLVWLAFFSAKQYVLFRRLDEDYAYKAAVSRAFEGYKKQMESVKTSSGTLDDPLLILCKRVLETIGESPGRIYDQGGSRVHPAEPGGGSDE